MSVRAALTAWVACASLFVSVPAHAQPALEVGCADGLERADTLLAGGDLAGAERAYVNALRACETDLEFASARPYVALASIYLDRGQWLDAASALEKAAKHDPQGLHVLAGLCHAYAELGEHDKALAFGLKAQKVKPAARPKGKAKLAEVDKAAELRARYRVAYGLGRAYLELAAAKLDSKDPRGQRLLEEAAKLDPKAAEPPYQLGRIELARQDLVKGKALFEKACALGHRGACAEVERLVGEEAGAGSSAGR